jgi:hypothetical protein
MIIAIIKKDIGDKINKVQIWFFVMIYHPYAMNKLIMINNVLKVTKAFYAKFVRMVIQESKKIIVFNVKTKFLFCYFLFLWQLLNQVFKYIKMRTYYSFC